MSIVAACVFLVVACGHDDRRAVPVEAGTASGSRRTGDNVTARGLPKLAVVDGESLAVPEGTAGMGSSTQEETAERYAVREDSRRARPARRPADAEAGDSRMTDPDPAVERGHRPPPPLLLPAGRILLPPGTVFPVELRTPIHTATTYVDDRFAARLTQDVAAGGRVVIPAGAMVEGRVSHVGSASEDGRIAFIELDARKVRLADGRHFRITADLLDVTGQEVLEAGAEESAAVARDMAGAELSKAAREARAAILAGILERVDGRAVVARSTDREIIIPTGTPFTLELVEPLEIPAP